MLYDCVTISNDLGESYCEQRRLIGFWMIVGYLELKVCFYTRLLLWSFDGWSMLWMCSPKTATLQI